MATATKIPISKKIKISIAVTDLASLCGMDHYDNWSKIICKIWKKYNNDDFTACESQLRATGHIALACDSTQKKISALESKYGQSGLISGAVKQINCNRSKSSLALVNAQDSVINGLDNTMGPALASQDKALLASLIKSATNTMHGVSHEGSGLELFSKVSGIKVVDTQASINYVFHEDDKYVWEINGRIDGITENGRIVEIKNRQKALFNTVRDYEMCQVQTYLHYKQMPMAYLVELLPGKTKADTTYNILEVVADVDYFAVYIRPWLLRLVDFVSRNLFTSHGLKECILKGDTDKEAYSCYARLDSE
jgi:hypothetical protein